MRVTEHRVIDLVTLATRNAREDVVEAQAGVNSGLRVEKPSDDVVGWSEGRRAAARAVRSDARETLLARARARLDETERVLKKIYDFVVRAKEIALQGANEATGPQERDAHAIEIRSLRQTILDAANERGSDGEYLFAGTDGDAPPFSSAGVYGDDDYRRTIEVGEGARRIATISGDVLTASHGVEVLEVLEDLAVALEGGVIADIETAVGDLDTGIEQVVGAMSEEVGVRAAALQQADEAREDFDLVLAGMKARAVEVDAVEAAGELAQSIAALESARSVAARVASLMRGA